MGRFGPSAVALAAAMLADTAGPAVARDWQVDFAFDVVARFPWDGFRCSTVDVLAWLDAAPAQPPPAATVVR